MRARAHLQSHPIHPMLVAFPLGLWITSFILDVAGVVLDNATLWIAGFCCVIAGCVGAALAAVPGAIDLFSVVPPRSTGKRRGLMHAGLNVCALALFIATAAYRGDPATEPNKVALLGSAIGVCLLLFSGWMGATLVYRNQIGVDHRYANAGKWKEREIESWDRPACNEGELAYGQMLLVRTEGQRIVVGRCADGIVAFGDHCTHRGGALCDGALAGCTVQCPWHGSQFDVKTGRVVAGPAEEKIEIYETRVINGEVFIVPPASVQQPRRAA